MPSAEAPAGDESPHDPYAEFRGKDFRQYLAGNVISTAGMQMQTVAVGWDVYNRLSHSPDEAYLALGIVGLVQVLPVLLLALPGGHVVDRYGRRRVLMLSMSVMAAASLGLAFLSATQGTLYAASRTATRGRHSGT